MQKMSIVKDFYGKIFKTCEDEKFLVVEAILAGKGNAISVKNLKPNAIDVYGRRVLRKKIWNL